MEESPGGRGAAGLPLADPLELDTLALATDATVVASATNRYCAAGSARAGIMGSTRLIVPTSAYARDGFLQSIKCNTDTAGERDPARSSCPRHGKRCFLSVEICVVFSLMRETSFTRIDIAWTPANGLVERPNAGRIAAGGAALDLLHDGVYRCCARHSRLPEMSGHHATQTQSTVSTR